MAEPIYARSVGWFRSKATMIDFGFSESGLTFIGQMHVAEWGHQVCGTTECLIDNGSCRRPPGIELGQYVRVIAVRQGVTK